MKRENSLKENIIWLLEQYKKELQKAKEEKTNDCEYGYDKDQFISDAENIIIELEFAIEVSK